MSEAVGSCSTNVVEQASAFVTSDLEFGQHVEAGGEVLRAVGLLRKVEQPTGLRRFMVAIKTRGI